MATASSRGLIDRLKEILRRSCRHQAIIPLNVNAEPINAANDQTDETLQVLNDPIEVLDPSFCPSEHPNDFGMILVQALDVYWWFFA